MTTVRSKRSKVVHAVDAARETRCGRIIKEQIVEPDAEVTCTRCVARG